MNAIPFYEIWKDLKVSLLPNQESYINQYFYAYQYNDKGYLLMFYHIKLCAGLFLCCVPFVL